MIGYGRQSINDADCEAVLAALQSGTLTQGPWLERFEQALCAATGARHAVAVSTGTAALECACRLAGIGPGSRVWVPAITFVATANAPISLGATVELVDVDSHGGNIDLDSLRSMLDAAASKPNALPDLLIVVHLAGRSCDMDAIHKLAAQYGFTVIEDACHALGARYRTIQPLRHAAQTPPEILPAERGRDSAYAGLSSCVGGDARSLATCFSFHPVKSITTGEGGAVMVADAQQAAELRRMRHHGIDRAAVPEPVTGAAGTACTGPVAALEVPVVDLYEQTSAGSNHRLSELHAALGTSQLARLDQFLAGRREIVRRYDELLGPLAQRGLLRLPQLDDGSAWHLYIVQFQSSILRDRAYQALRQAGLQSALHYPPLNRHAWHRSRFAHFVGEGAASYAERSLSVPLYFDLPDAAVLRVVETLKQTLGYSSADLSQREEGLPL